MIFREGRGAGGWIIYIRKGLPGGSDCKEPACNAGDPGSIPGLRRSPGERNGHPLQYSCLENFMDKVPFRLQFTGSQKEGHDWTANTHTHTHTHTRNHHKKPKGRGLESLWVGKHVEIWKSGVLRVGFTIPCPMHLFHLVVPKLYHFIVIWKGFPGGSAGKQSACDAGDPCSIPRLGRFLGEGKGYLLQYSGLENSMSYVVHRVTKSWTWLSDFHFTSLQWSQK